jgi:hypothetical protein
MEHMFALIALITTLIVGLLAPRYGVDSRRDEKNW